MADRCRAAEGFVRACWHSGGLVGITACAAVYPDLTLREYQRIAEGDWRVIGVGNHALLVAMDRAPA